MLDFKTIVETLVVLASTTKDIEKNIEEIKEIASKIAYTTNAFNDEKGNDLMFDLYYAVVEDEEEAEFILQLIKKLVNYSA